MTRLHLRIAGRVASRKFRPVSVSDVAYQLSVCPTASRLYFVDKVASVRRSTGGSEASTVLPPTTARLDQSVVCSAEDIQKVITAVQLSPVR